LQLTLINWGMASGSDTNRPCSVARTLEVLGDRWTFLILREVFFGVHRFDAFQKSLGIARNILTDRLKSLVREDILERRPYQENPPRYEYRLTERGRDLYGLILGIIRWGDRWLDKGAGPPLLLHHEACKHDLTPVLVCDHCREEARPEDVTYRDGPGANR